jgi:hypothetical protein
MRWTPAFAAVETVAERAERVSLVEGWVWDWATASLSFCGMITWIRMNYYINVLIGDHPRSRW